MTVDNRETDDGSIRFESGKKKLHRKEVTPNGSKVRLFNRECFRKIILSGLSSCLPIQILIFPHSELAWVPVMIQPGRLR